MISSNMFSLIVNNANSYDYSPTNGAIIKTLEKAKSELPEILMKYSKEEKAKVALNSICCNSRISVFSGIAAHLIELRLKSFHFTHSEAAQNANFFIPPLLKN